MLQDTTTTTQGFPGMGCNSRERCPLIQFVGLFVIAIFAHSTQAEVASEPSANTQRPRIGVVLSGGGARGLAHVGVLKVLEELRIPVDCIAGTSMGALVAGAYAAGVAPEEMERKVRLIDWNEIFTDDPERTAIPYRQKKDQFLTYFDMELGLQDGRLLTPPGSTSGYKFEFFIRELIGLSLGNHDIDFDTLPVPYRAIATDLEHGTEKTFTHGDLARIMRASMSVPGVIAPTEIDGQLYVDGGLVNNLPIDAAREMCADIIIAVNLGTPLMTRAELQSVFAVSAQSINLLTELNVKQSLSSLGNHDVLISPALEDVGSGDFVDALKAVPRGEQAARDVADYLRTLSVSEEDYAAYRRRRSARLPATPPVTAYRFAPTKDVSPSVLEPELQLDTGETFDQMQLHANLVRLYGRGDFERVAYHIEDDTTGRTVVIEPVEKSWGPNYLKFGFGLASDFSSNSRVAFSASHRSTWLNSRGAEWRNELQMGFTDRFSSELFQPYSARRGSAFVAARAEINTSPEIYYLEGRRVGEYDITTARAHLEVGAQDHFGEFRLGVFSGSLRASEDFGFLPFVPEYNLNQAGVTLDFIFDQLDNADFPRHGAVIAGNVFSTHADLGSDDDYNKAELAAQWAYTKERHTLVPGVFVGDNLGSEIPPYDPFQLGGFLRLSGYRIDELSGADYALARLTYYYRYAALPPQVGGGIYIGGSLEVGRIRDGVDESISGKPQAAGSFFIGADTAIGPLRLAIGHAERGHTSFYFLLGRALPL